MAWIESGMIVAAGLALAAQPPQGGDSASERARDIATSPARDVGIERTRIPDILVRAAEDPYGLAGLRSCADIAAAVAGLNATLGPDFDSTPARRGTRAGRIAEAGGQAVVSSLIPFRGVVRELSGSAEADRRMNAATDAGIARRGFLRGLQQQRGCPGRPR